MNIPNRRKSKDNPYTLSISNEGKYLVSFKNTNNYKVCIEVGYLIYKTLNEFELKDLSQLNEFDRHIEHLDLIENDEVLYRRIIKKELSIEEIVNIKLSKEKLIYAINKLSINQKTRIMKYYFDGKTESDIALEENVTQQSVHIGLKRANDLKKGLIYHDAHSNGKIGYYPHFHYYDKNIDAHIWFYPLY